MTRQEAGHLIAILATAYSIPAWSEETIRLYVDMLADLDHHHAQTAVQHWINTQPDRPAIADIRRLVAESACDLPSPEEAYGMVHDVLSCHGDHGLPEAVAEAVRLTGRSWEALAYMQFDDYPWFRRDFLNAYREVRQRVLTGAQLRQGALPDRNEARRLLDEIRRQGGGEA